MEVADLIVWCAFTPEKHSMLLSNNVLGLYSVGKHKFYVSPHFLNNAKLDSSMWRPLDGIKLFINVTICCQELHDDVIKWKHFPCYWPFVRGIHRSLVYSSHKSQWRGVLMFSFICAWTNGWVNTLDAGDLRRYRAHYDVTVMPCSGFRSTPTPPSYHDSIINSLSLLMLSLCIEFYPFSLLSDMAKFLNISVIVAM